MRKPTNKHKQYRSYAVLISMFSNVEKMVSFLESKIPSSVKILPIALDSKFTLDKRYSELISLIKTEDKFTVVFYDDIVSSVFPELLKFQESIVIFKHRNHTDDTDQITYFTEPLCIQHGARFDYLNEAIQLKQPKLSILELDRYKIDNEEYKKMFKRYEGQKLLKRFSELDAKSRSEDVSLKDQVKI